MFSVLGQAKIVPDKVVEIQGKQTTEKPAECWGPLALAGGRLYARDLTRMVCIDLRK
jgi:hypothetical protein